MTEKSFAQTVIDYHEEKVEMVKSERVMKQKFKIGIVGYGFVGKAVDYAFTHPDVEKFYVDPKYDTGIDDLVAWQPNMVFICAPTPMGSQGIIDATIVEDAVLKIFHHTKAGVSVKSTVTPDLIQRLAFTADQLGCGNRFVYNPEFLTENSAIEQFVNAPFHIFGGRPEAIDGLLFVYGMFSMCRLDNIQRMGAVEAAFTKYAINSFLAMKVTFFNQLYDAAQTMGAQYNHILAGVESDPRIGRSHTKVPGFDGKRGFGGACFPKDVLAFNKVFKGFTLLDNVVTINNTYRSQYELDEREKAQHVDYGQAKKELKDQIDGYPV
jgi:nucleotide sugar dehydrogenase